MFIGKALDKIQVLDLLHKVDELSAAVAELATQIAGNAPLTMAAAKLAIKRALTDEVGNDHRTVDQAVTACFASADYVEGRRAFGEKRRPQFMGN
jgi:enoyl-CoA hydratase/carnithine racemase